MNCIIISLGFATVLGLLLGYSGLTQSRALALRDDMVDDMSQALSRSSLSAEGRRAALSLFNASLKPGAVPRFILKMLWYRWRDRLDDLDHGLADKDYPVLSKLIRRHVLPINFAAGPHWYLLLAVGVALAAFVAAVTGYAFRWTDAQKARLEHALINAFADVAH